MQDFSGEKRGVCAGYVGNLAKSQRSHSSFSPIVRTLNNFSVFFTVTRLCCQTKEIRLVNIPLNDQVQLQDIML